MVAGVSFKSTKQKGKGVLYDTLPRIFTYFYNMCRSPLWTRVKLLRGVMLTITSPTHGGEDFGLGRQSEIAGSGTKIGRTRITE